MADDLKDIEAVLQTYFDGLSARSRDLPRRDFVISIDRSGPNTAFAKVNCQIPPRYFTDYLVLARLAGGWKIVSKTFHTDTREG